MEEALVVNRFHRRLIVMEVPHEDISALEQNLTGFVDVGHGALHGLAGAEKIEIGEILGVESGHGTGGFAHTESVVDEKVQREEEIARFLGEVGGTREEVYRLVETELGLHLGVDELVE